MCGLFTSSERESPHPPVAAAAPPTPRRKTSPSKNTSRLRITHLLTRIEDRSCGPPSLFRPSPSPLPANIAAVSRTTYAIEDAGPYDEDEVREKIRAYCDEHGFHAALGLTVIEMTEGGTTVRRVEAGQFLD